MAAAHAGRRGSESVALISFADQRIGAWTQVQMLAARSGIDSFKVSDAALLGPLLSELSNRELVIIDTAAPAWQGSLAIISECAPAAKMHLLLPADASASTIRRFQSPGTGAWESLMLSKLDESTHSWPVIQALCNQEFALSLGSHDGSPEASAREIEVSELIERALAQCPGLPAEPAPQTAQAPRARRTSARKQTKDVRHAA
jgi:flagellar biosynthesis GTPase FlhF